MVPAADRVKKPGQSSVWMDAKKSPGGGAGGRGGSGGGRRSDPAAAHLDRDRITAVTVALLDADGLDKFSMRRLAAELKVTAMSVYWYVATKDDLLELALDHVAGEIVLPDPDDDTDWRIQLRQLAQSYRELLVGHPWATLLVGRFLNIGPHFMAFSGATLAVMRRTGAPLERHGGMIAAVFQFVFGFATSEAQFNRLAAEAELTTDEFFQRSMGLIAGEIEESPLFRESTELMAARGGDTVAEMYDRDFENALDVLIAGIETSGATKRPE
uniref:TetR/AcrR family transcriptional regulator n=1 Tax=Streptomyces sp. NPDC004111 TaxID=3364690 RepID=UPI0036ACB1CD